MFREPGLGTEERSLLRSDISRDDRVHLDDVAQWQRFKALTDGSSWADINQDGLIGETDKQLIEAAFGPCDAG